MSQLTAQNLTVTFEGTTHTVTTTTADYIRFDVLRPKHKWPAMQDAPFLFMAVLAWSALTRTGVEVPPVGLFLDTVEEVDAPDELVPVDPIPPAPEAG